MSARTGYPSQNRQIGIVTGNAFVGDVISTGLYNQTPEEFLRIMEEISSEMKIEGFLMDRNGKIFYSSGFLEYIEK